MTPPPRPLLPRGWSVRPLPDGGIQFTHRDRRKLAFDMTVMCGLGGLLFMMIGIAMPLLDNFSPAPWGWSLAFFIVGAGMIYNYLLWLTWKLELLVHANDVVVRRSTFSFGSSERRYTRASLKVSPSADSDGHRDWDLSLTAPEGKELLESEDSWPPNGPPSEALLTLARLLAQQTGWPLQVEEAEPPRK